MARSMINVSGKFREDESELRETSARDTIAAKQEQKQGTEKEKTKKQQQI